MIFLLDTTALIEFKQIFCPLAVDQLVAIEVLDVVLSECEERSHSDLIQIIGRAGVQAIPTKTAWFNAARRYRDGTISVQDALNLYYARTFVRILITNEKPLQAKCQQERVTTREFSWLIQQLTGCLSQEAAPPWLRHPTR